MPKLILVAHDLSVEADIAVRRAAELAREHDGEVVLLHAVADSPSALQAQRTRQSAEAALHDSARQAGLAAARTLVGEGPAATVIAAIAEELGADLLVTGRHHRQLLERFDGTTLEQILRSCRVPALLALDEGLATYRRALSALDFSVAACNALRAACQWLPADSELLAVHAYDAGKDDERLQERLDEQHALLEQMMWDEHAQADAQLRHLECRISPLGIRETLDRQLADWQPQLLVLGSRGRSALQQALLGSTARHYLRHPPCDLLVSA